MAEKFRDRTVGPTIAREASLQANAAADSARDTQTRSDLTSLIQMTSSADRSYADTTAGTSAAAVSTALSGEISRATSAEGNLQSQIGTTANNLVSEVLRAQGAETTNASAIAGALARLNSTETPQILSTSGTGTAGTSTVPARADHIHEINIQSYVASGTIDTTTTASTGSPSVMNLMTLTPGAGTYFVLFGTSIEHSNQNASVTCSIYANGVVLSGSQRVIIPRPNSIGANSLSIPVSCQAVATVGAGQTIEGRWGTSTGTGTAHQRSLLLIKVS